MKQIVVVTGPTASGKTELAVDLALALGGEVVSADSMQIYRGMDIGTAKPTPSEMRGVPHHMLDVAEPGESYSVSRYEQEAACCVDDILSRGRLPVVCGGTGQYIDALIAGTGFLESGAESGIRARLEQEWDACGAAAMLARLGQFDPQSAARLHPNDRKRVIRAIEVYELTGKTMTQHNEETCLRAPRYRAAMLALNTEPRDILYARIDLRVRRMLEAGLVREIIALRESGALRGTAAQAIGYKEFSDYLDGNGTLEDAAALVAQKSRNYAKRQLTWLRRNDKIQWIVYNHIDAKQEVFEKATAFLQHMGIK
ncbi:MAG: tRNA (adenosine(37)-N6)-dimethylallyltransferase MiaA [Clostridium sp. SCN 57-10]|mgnify:CR=1 FL=1|nr:MAG: tRNA (adenosine(37)-N6)-dimethylallyltransferase MiaA [Clostridium sp. SCN 57-10]